MTNFRSIGERVELAFPTKGPLVLLGPNNAGKSNLVRAVELVLGDRWPGSFEPEDHDLHGRSREAVPMRVTVELDEAFVPVKDGFFEVSELAWRYDPDDERPILFEMVAPDGSRRWANSEARDQCFCMVVGADRRLHYQLSYTSKYTLLSRLMRRFHAALVDDEERVSRLRDLFEDVVKTFYEVEPFAKFSTDLKESAASFAANLEYRLDLDFSAYDPSNFFHSLRVHPLAGGVVRTFQELGTGQEQILALAFAYAYGAAFGAGGDAGLLLVIEEPEAHLHPLAQQWLGRHIHALADTGVQVLVTTHSPAFVEVEHLDGLALVTKSSEQSATRATQRSPTSLAEFCNDHGAAGKATPGTVLPFYAASATEGIIRGFFARCCVLVEGPTESFALPTLLRRAGIDLLEHGIDVIAVGGIGNLARWWRLFRAYDIPVFVVFDRDSDDDESGARRADLAGTLGVEVAALETETSGSALAVLPTYAVFAPAFEQSMRTLFPTNFGDLAGRGRERLGGSKVLCARYAVERLPLDHDADGWRLVRELGAAIMAVANANPDATDSVGNDAA
ncbi:MAG TPA: AAA family ATPase [Acidimicrobiales bacterium]|nr:AAA family ATPase [Acidimicrobiales bacterium]